MDLNDQNLEACRQTGGLWRAILWSLRITVALQSLGVARLAIGFHTQIFSLLCDETELGGFGLSEAVAMRVDMVAAYLLIGCGILTLIRPCWPVLSAIALWHLLLAVAVMQIGGTPFAELTLAAHAVRIAAPLALIFLEPWPRRAVSDKAIAGSMWFLRIAAALTFVAHGYEAWRLHPGFVDYLIVAGHKLLAVELTQSSMEVLLRVIAIVDFLVALLLVFTHSRMIAFYMALWGLVTALSRIVHAGDTWDGLNFSYHETLLRAANSGVPLAIGLYFIWRRNSNSPVNSANRNLENEK